MPAALRHAPAEDVEILAYTLCVEAGARPVRALEALACLVVNRARAALAEDTARLRFAPQLRRRGSQALWPLLLGAVCRAPFQFRCWHPRAPRPQPDMATLAVCRRIATRAAAGSLADPTGGATHWHDGAELPPWALGQVPLAEVSGLVFYRLPG